MAVKGVPVLFSDQAASQAASAWLEKREVLGLPCPILEGTTGDARQAALTVARSLVPFPL